MNCKVKASGKRHYDAWTRYRKPSIVVHAFIKKLYSFLQVILKILDIRQFYHYLKHNITLNLNSAFLWQQPQNTAKPCKILIDTPAANLNQHFFRNLIRCMK